MKLGFVYIFLFGRHFKTPISVFHNPPRGSKLLTLGTTALQVSVMLLLMLLCTILVLDNWDMSSTSFPPHTDRLV